LENGTHVHKEVSHLFSCHIQQQVDILIIRNGFRTLLDVIIVDMTHLNMVQQTSMTITHAMVMVVLEKSRTYAKRTLGDDFIPFAIEMYGCLHFCFDSFLTTYS
jgi:hypothetical protein